jgi:hypothetical protein
MDEAGIRTDIFGEVGQEGDNVVLGLTLDLVDAGDFPFALLPDRLGRRFGNDAQFGLGIAGVSLDFEPDAEPVFRGIIGNLSNEDRGLRKVSDRAGTITTTPGERQRVRNGASLRGGAAAFNRVSTLSTAF